MEDALKGGIIEEMLEVYTVEEKESLEREKYLKVENECYIYHYLIYVI